MRIVETDNFDGDYPDEKFVNLPLLTLDAAEKICGLINAICSGENAPRYWKVVNDHYKLRPGFEP
jgi:hypothetical protein